MRAATTPTAASSIRNQTIKGHRSVVLAGEILRDSPNPRQREPALDEPAAHPGIPQCRWYKIARVGLKRGHNVIIVTIVALGILLAAAVYGVMLYNNLVQVKHNVSKAWANIDVLLKQRHDELPKLVETCKQYMKFEQDTLTKVMEARSKVSTARSEEHTSELQSQFHLVCRLLLEK